MAQPPKDLNRPTLVQTRVPPRRGSFQEEPIVLNAAHQAYSMSTDRGRVHLDDEAGQTIEVVNADAAEKSGQQSVLPQTIDLDDDSMLTDDDRGFTKSSSGSRRQSKTPSISRSNPILPQPSPSSEESAIETGQNAYQLPADPNARTGKLRNKYVMSDGTVVNGKGLGRGRPGIKRGPRKSALSNEITGTSDADSVTPFTPSPAPQKLSVPVKRKRADSDPSELKDDEDEFSPSSRESTPEYNPTASTQTRSGRQSQKPAPIVAPPTSSTKVPAKRHALPQVASSPSIKKHPKIKAKVYRGREQFALCEHCLRGNGPPGNVIVFCDACNKCWHQRCHDPKISKELVADTSAEWFCSDCDRILHGKKKNKQPPSKPNPQPVPAVTTTPAQSTIPNTDQNTAPRPRYALPYIPGMALTLAQRKQYLDSLSRDRLIEIVLRAADLAPNMPIFETPLHEIPQSSLFPPHSQFPFPTLPKSMRPPIPPGLPQPPPPPPPPQSLPQQRQLSQQHHRQPPVPTHTFTAHPPIQTTVPTTAAPTTTIPIYSHPTAGTPSKPNTMPIPLPIQSTSTTVATGPIAAPDEDEGYYDDYDELALVYSKPGEGVYNLVLPPESTDLGMLLEGPDSRTFSHWVRGRGEMKRVVDVRG